MNPYEPPEAELKPPRRKRGRIRPSILLFVLVVGCTVFVRELFEVRVTIGGIIPAAAAVGALAWVILRR